VAGGIDAAMAVAVAAAADRHGLVADWLNDRAKPWLLAATPRVAPDVTIIRVGPDRFSPDRCDVDLKELTQHSRSTGID